MSSPNNFVAFADREATFELSDGALVNHLNLPVGTDLERIEFNLARMERLTRWAGAKQLVLASADLGNEHLQHYDIEDIGGGVAGAKAVRKDSDEHHHVHTYVDDNNPMRNFPLSDVPMPGEVSERRLAAYKADSLVLHLDTRSLAHKVGENKRAARGQLDERVWAGTLDREVRRGISGAAYARYFEPDKFDGVMHPIWSLLFYSEVYDFAAHNGSPFFTGMTIGLKGLQLAVGTHRIRAGEAGMRDYNWSAQLFTGARTDRWLATAATAQFGGKAIRHKK